MFVRSITEPQTRNDRGKKSISATEKENCKTEIKTVSDMKCEKKQRLGGKETPAAALAKKEVSNMKKDINIAGCLTILWLSAEVFWGKAEEEFR